MNPLLLALPGGLAIPVLAALFGSLLYAANRHQKAQSGSGTASELATAQYLQNQRAIGGAVSASNAAISSSNATASLINNFNPSALVDASLPSSSFTKSITDLVAKSTAPLQTEIAGLTNVVSKIPSNLTVTVNAPAGPPPNSWGNGFGLF